MMRDLHKKLFGVALGCLVCQCNATTIRTVEEYHSLVTEKAYLARLSMLRSMESTAAWVKDREGRFGESIAVYISKVLGDLVSSRGAFVGTNMYNSHKREDGVENKRGQVLEIAIEAGRRSGANWNALMFKNYLAGAYWDHFYHSDDYNKDAMFSELGIDLVAETLRDNYHNKFDKQINAAASDIKKYLKALDLYRFLQEMDSTKEGYKDFRDEIAPFAIGNIEFNNDKEKDGLVKHASFEVTAFVENEGKKEAKRLLGCIDNGKFIGFQIRDNIGKDGKPFVNDSFVQLDGYMRVIDPKVSIANAAFENINAIEYDSLWDELATIAELEGYFDDEAELENGLSTIDYKLVLGKDVNLDGDELRFFNEKFPLLFDRFRRAESLEKYKDEQAIARAFVAFVRLEHGRFFETGEDKRLFKRVWEAINLGILGVEKKEVSLAQDVKKNGAEIADRELYGKYYRIVIDEGNALRALQGIKKSMALKVIKQEVMKAFAAYKKEKGINLKLQGWHLSFSDDIASDFMAFMREKAETQAAKVVNGKRFLTMKTALAAMDKYNVNVHFVTVDPLWDKLGELMDVRYYHSFDSKKNREIENLDALPHPDRYKFGKFRLVIDASQMSGDAPREDLLKRALYLVNWEYVNALSSYKSVMDEAAFSDDDADVSQLRNGFHEYLTVTRVNKQAALKSDRIVDKLMTTALDAVKKLNIKCRFEDASAIGGNLSQSQSAVDNKELLARSMSSVSSESSNRSNLFDEDSFNLF